MFCIIQPLFLQKTKPSNIFLGLDFELGRKELGFWPSCVRSPWQDKSYAKKIKRVDSYSFCTEIIFEDAFFLISLEKR